MANRIDRLVSKYRSLGSGTGSTTGTAISGAYTFGSAGNAFGLRWTARNTSPLVDVYFFVSAVGGTGGTVTLELRGTSSSTVPNSTIHASTTVATPTANEWYKATFGSPHTPTRGDVYNVVCSSNDGTNFPTILRGGPSVNELAYQYLGAFTSTNGFSTGSNQATTPCAVLVHADGTIYGQPYTSAGNDASNSRERGVKILGLDQDTVISAVTSGVNWVNVNSVKIYANGTAPGGTTLQTHTVSASQLAQSAAMFTPYTLLKNTVYRVVLGFSGGTTAPGLFTIQDYAASGYSAVLDGVSFKGQYGIIHTIDDGAGGWTDSDDKYPRMQILVDSVTVPTGATYRSPFNRLRSK